MVGGEVRKSRNPLLVTESKASATFRRASSWSRFETTSKIINLKGLTSFIARNVLYNVISEDKWAIESLPSMRASSENTGDVIVENISMRVV